MSIITRPARLPQDYPAIAAVLADENPGWAATSEELAHEEAGRDPRYHHAVFVAEQGDGTERQMVGVGFIGHDTLAHREGKFLLDLRVRPDYQGQGAGKALYAAILEHLVPLAPRELHTMVWHLHPRAHQFLLERGFREAWRRLDLFLDVANFDFAPYAGLEEKLLARGLMLKTYAELAHDPDRLRKLYELDWALWQDVPYGEPPVKRSLAQFAAEEVDHPQYLPDACFIALYEGAFIGYLNLTDNPECLETAMTGVLPAWRGQGVATLLKLYSIRYAQAHGNRQLGTTNDPANAAMLALNEKLGFVRTGAQVRYVKKMET